MPEPASVDLRDAFDRLWRIHDNLIGARGKELRKDKLAIAAILARFSPGRPA